MNSLKTTVIINAMFAGLFLTMIVASMPTKPAQEKEEAVPKPIAVNTYAFEVTHTETNSPSFVVGVRYDRALQYVEEYAPLARAEQARVGIPASIKLAQGLLESKAGTSRLCRNNNNHFGIKCFIKNCTSKHCVPAIDEELCMFRNFESDTVSYKAHSDVLLSQRYCALNDLSIEDYEGWAKGLKQAGYATHYGYADLLIKIIEDMELYKYDQNLST